MAMLVLLTRRSVLKGQETKPKKNTKNKCFTKNGVIKSRFILDINIKDRDK